jgi:hypothetical protein
MIRLEELGKLSYIGSLGACLDITFLALLRVTALEFSIVAEFSTEAEFSTKVEAFASLRSIAYASSR